MHAERKPFISSEFAGDKFRSGAFWSLLSFSFVNCVTKSWDDSGKTSTKWFNGNSFTRHHDSAVKMTLNMIDKYVLTWDPADRIFSSRDYPRCILIRVCFVVCSTMRLREFVLCSLLEYYCDIPLVVVILPKMKY